MKEAYIHFKQEYSNHKIGFYKFADVWPKWCVLAGSTGTHSVYLYDSPKCQANDDSFTMTDGFIDKTQCI